MKIAFSIIVFITGLLLGIVIENKRYQKKITKILDEILKEKK